METIKEKAKKYAMNKSDMYCGNCDTCSTKCRDYRKYVDISTEQKAVDIKKICDWLPNCFIIEHGTISIVGCDVLLRELHKAMEE